MALLLDIAGMTLEFAELKKLFSIISQKADQTIKSVILMKINAFRIFRNLKSQHS